ncbi:UNVERIFIED_CONTAM: hypothetical protein RMT77_014255 [Armadillidium vulgare]
MKSKKKSRSDKISEKIVRLLEELNEKEKYKMFSKLKHYMKEINSSDEDSSHSSSSSGSSISNPSRGTTPSSPISKKNKNLFSNPSTQSDSEKEEVYCIDKEIGYYEGLKEEQFMGYNYYYKNPLQKSMMEYYFKIYSSNYTSSPQENESENVDESFKNKAIKCFFCSKVIHRSLKEHLNSKRHEDIDKDKKNMLIYCVQQVLFYTSEKNSVGVLCVRCNKIFNHMGNHIRLKHENLSNSERKDLKKDSPPVIGGRKKQTTSKSEESEARNKKDNDDDDQMVGTKQQQQQQQQRLKEESLHQKSEKELVTKYKIFLKENKILYEKDLFRFQNIEKNILDVFNALRNTTTLMPPSEKKIKITETKFHFLGMEDFKDRKRYLNNLLGWLKATTLSPNTLVIKMDDFAKFIRKMINLGEIPKKKKANIKEFLSTEIPAFKNRVINSKAAYMQRKDKKDADKMFFAEDAGKVLTHKFFQLGFTKLVDGNLKSKTYTPAILRNIIIFLLLVATSGRAGVISNLTIEEYHNIQKIIKIKETKNPGEKKGEEEEGDDDDDDDETVSSTTTMTTTTTTMTTTTTTTTTNLTSTLVNDDENQNLYALECQRHKTQHMYGDAKMILTHATKMGLDSYVTFIRPLFLEEAKRAAIADNVEEKESDDDDDDEEDKTPKKSNSINPLNLLFLSSQGRPFTTQALNNAMGNLTKMCDLSKKFTSTTNRKGTTTETAIAQPELRRNVARFMYHHENTAEKYYNATLSTISIANTFLQTKKGNLILQFSSNFKKDENNDDDTKIDDDEEKREYGGKKFEDDYVQDKEDDGGEEGGGGGGVVIIEEEDDGDVDDGDVDDDYVDDDVDVDEDNFDNEEENDDIHKDIRDIKEKESEELEEREEREFVEDEQISSFNIVVSPSGKRKQNDERECVKKKKVHFQSPAKQLQQSTSSPGGRTKYLGNESVNETMEHVSCTPSFSLFEQNTLRERREIPEKNEDGETSKTSPPNLQTPSISTPNLSYCETPLFAPPHFLEAVENEYGEQQKIDDNLEENRGMFVSTRKRMKKNIEEINNFQPLEADTPTRILMDLRMKSTRGHKKLFNSEERKYLFSIFREEIDDGIEDIPSSRIREKLSNYVIKFYCKELNKNEGIVVNRIRSTIRSYILALNKKKRKMLKE